jgi:YHS domain-containing protein
MQVSEGRLAMTDIERLGQRIQDKLAVSEERLRLRQGHVQEVMRAADEAQAAYTTTADRLMESVVRPRVAEVKSRLDAVATAEQSGTRHGCCLRLAHTPRFPATARLEVAITRDGDARTLSVQYRLQILPAFFPFAGADDLAFPANQVDPERVATWLDDKLVDFVETYLRLEIEPDYQAEGRVIDPVCGMNVNRADAPASAEHAGKTYYFCVRECRDRFLADPDRYVPRRNEAS